MVQVLKLTPGNLTADAPLPNWGRFPRLKTLRLSSWPQTATCNSDEGDEASKVGDDEEEQPILQVVRRQLEQIDVLARCFGFAPSGDGTSGQRRKQQQRQRQRAPQWEAQADEGDRHHQQAPWGGGDGQQQRDEGGGSGHEGERQHAGAMHLKLESVQISIEDFEEIISSLPRLRALTMDTRTRIDLEGHPFALSEAAPGLEWLSAPEVSYADDLGAALARLPRLSSLELGEMPDGAGECHDLPLERLTSLAALNLHLGVDSICRLSNLAEIRGITLDVTTGQALSEAAKGLRLLACDLVGEWGPEATGDAFKYPRLTHAFLTTCDGPRALHISVPQLMPAVECFGLCPGWEFHGEDDPQPEPLRLLHGLTALRTLAINDFTPFEHFPSDWDAISSCPHLRQLSCTLNPNKEEALARLGALTSVELLEVTLCLEYKDESDESEIQPVEVSTFLEAATSSMPRLQSLLVAVADHRHQGGATPLHWHFGGVLRFARCSSALRRLRLYPNVHVPANVLGVLAVHQSLQRLEVGRGNADEEMVEKLASEVFEAGGPSIDVADSFGNEVTFWRYKMQDVAGD